MKVISKNSLSFILGLSVAFLACGKGIKAQDFVEDTAAETTEEVTKENLSIGDFVEGILAEAPIIIDRGRQLIENLNAENLVNTVYGTLGELGLLDPQEEANRTATSPDSPYSNPESTTETDEMGRAADARQSQTIQRLSQIVFNKQGQEVVAEQNQILQETQEGASLSQEAVVQTHGISKEIGVRSLNSAEATSLAAADALAAEASQDVLKAIAAQNEYTAQIESGISEQLTLLTEAQIYGGIQMKGLNTQLTVLNQREQNMQLYDAAQILQLSEIDNNLEQQTEMDKYHRRIDSIQAQTGMTKVYLPGLFIK